MVNSELIWSKEEYDSVYEYKGNSYALMNVLLNRNVTKREMRGKYIHKQIIQDSKVLRKIINRILNIYSAVMKNYLLNGSKKLNKKVFRGMSDGVMNTSFISTSESVWTAFGFARRIETMPNENGLLLMLETENVPWVDFDKILPSSIGIDEEPEILLLPFQVESTEETDLKELFDIAKNQGENIINENIILSKFKNLKCEKIKAREVDYSKIESELTMDNLCDMVDEYASNIKKIRTMDSHSLEFIHAYSRILEFKKACNDYLCQKFKYINEILKVEINKDDSKIDLSSEYDMQRVKIGNTGEMYYINDLKSGKEYYFKPAVTKSGEKRDYRAYIQEAAYSVQKVINPEVAIKCNVININGRFGAIQEKINVDIDATKKFINYFENGIGELSSDMIQQILNEYLVDYALCNYDAHASNFVIDENGDLRGIDKEQSFRYIYKESENDMMFSVNFNKKYGESETIYATLFKQIMDGKISSKYLELLNYRASRLAQIPDDEYRNIFKDYVYEKSKNQEEAEGLLNKIIQRKEGIVDRIEYLIEDIVKENYRKSGKNSIIDSAVLATKDRVIMSEIDIQSKNIKDILLFKSNVFDEKELEDK